jgi:hypothetical protein
MKNLSVVILVSVILSGLYSCKDKPSETDFNPNVLSAKDFLRAEDAMYEIVNFLFKGINDTLIITDNYGYIDNCEIYWYPDEKLLTFGYGDVNRMCQDGKFRRGSYFAQFDGEKWDVGVKTVITTDRLYVDDSLVEAHIEITKNGINAENLQEFAMNTLFCTVKLQDSTKLNPVNISADLTLAWSEGYLTPEIHEDDIYIVNGSYTGTSTDGYVFSVEVQDPLSDPIDCFWISAGLSSITVPEADLQMGTIDYITDDGCFNEMNFYFNENKFYDILK